MKSLIVILSSSIAIHAVDAHGSMKIPRERSMGNYGHGNLSPNGGDVDHTLVDNGCDMATCMWFNQGCCIGCKACDDTFNNFMNFSSACGLKKAPDTLPNYARTINNIDLFVDFTRHHPWRSPGNAPMMDSCGISGGSFVNNDRAGGFGNNSIVHKQGARGSALPRLDAKWTLKWTVGEAVEVSWGISANHGGGYQYRLCPASEALTEECFQKTPLSFSGAKSWLRWSNGEQVEIDAVRVTKGTTPAGSEWRMNPIPACKEGFGAGNPCEKPQFPPPTGCNETCWGYQPNGTYSRGSKTLEIPAIVDKVLIPKDLTPGDYVVGWRWDCEQTPQIWSGCGDVIVMGSDDVVV